VTDPVPLLGSIEAGGTKFVCAVGTGPDDIRDRVRIDTVRPEDTLGSVVEFFATGPPVAAVGIAAFGPLELRAHHPGYGHITTTPKPGWSGADLVGPVRMALDVPVAIDTDVNGAGLGEWRWGAGRGLDNVVYLTIGTGLGGGAIVGGRPVAGLVHPEMGHMSVERLEGDDFAGVCPFHGDCFEGMACGPAIEARWGRRGEELGELASEAIEIEAHYLAAGIRNLVYTLAPQRVIVGGGVGQIPGLVPLAQTKLIGLMAGYAVQPEHSARFVVTPELGDDAGIAGGFVLAESALP
jgi:fructokinase